MTRCRHVYLSPHFDDAVLSCGGTIHQQVAAGEPALVVTVFAAAPATVELSPLAESFHRRWAIAGDVIAARREENRVALSILGAESCELAYRDAIYRGAPGAWRYENASSLMAAPAAGDAELVAAIVAPLRSALAAHPGATVHAPLAIGHHVDHQLVHAAAHELLRVGHVVEFFEDYPYVHVHGPDHPHGLAPTLAARKGAATFRLRRLSDADLAARIAAIRAYRSQLAMLFGNPADVGTRVRTQACRTGNGQPAERSWVLAG